MVSLLSSLLMWSILIAAVSVGADYITYEDRQTKWERAHPGQNYIRGYRKINLNS